MKVRLIREFRITNQNLKKIWACLKSSVSQLSIHGFQQTQRHLEAGNSSFISYFMAFVRGGLFQGEIRLRSSPQIASKILKKKIFLTILSSFLCRLRQGPGLDLQAGLGLEEHLLLDFGDGSVIQVGRSFFKQLVMAIQTAVAKKFAQSIYN